jgi:hypothetical protein
MAIHLAAANESGNLEINAANVSSNLRLADLAGGGDRQFGGNSSSSGIISSRYGGTERKKSEGKPKDGEQGLKVRKEGTRLGGVRRTSLLYKIVYLEAMLFTGILAGYSVTRVFPARKGPMADGLQAWPPG